MGSSIAYHLSSMGCRNVTVIEKDPGYKHASAMLSAGGIRQQFSVRENILMSKYGIEFLKDPYKLFVPTENNFEPPDYQFRENGYLFVSSTKEGLDTLNETNRTQRDAGVTWTHMLDPSLMAAKFPWLHVDDLTGGSFGTKNEGYFDPWSLLSALKTKAISQGVTYVEGSVNDAVMGQPSGASPSCTPIKSVVVKSAQGNVEEFTAPVFVNACGPWAGKVVDIFASRSGTSISRVPVKPRKRSVFLFHRKPTDGNEPAFQTSTDEGSNHPSPSISPLVIDPSGVWFRSEGTDNNFICGMSPLEEGSPFANPENGNYIDENGNNIITHDPDCESEDDLLKPDHAVFDEFIWPTLFHRVPAFGDLKPKSAWAGFYEYNTFDQNAIIGQHPDIPNLMLCNGFSGHGLQQSPAAGRAIAELIADKRFQTIDLSRFSFDRILSNKPIYEVGIV